MGRGRLLVGEEDRRVRLLAASALRSAQFRVIECSNLEQIVNIAEDVGARLDALVIGTLPGSLELRDVLQIVRNRNISTPAMLLLGARDHARDRLSSLTLGGDLVVKPFSPAELVSRTRLILARAGRLDSSTVQRVGDLELDDRALAVRHAGTEIDLSPIEYRLLRHLVEHVDVVLSRSEILEYVWPYDYSGSPRNVDTHVASLRHKLGSSDNDLIQTVVGVGYRMRVKPS